MTLLEQYLDLESKEPYPAKTKEWEVYWAQPKKNPSKDIIPEMFTEEFSEWCNKLWYLWYEMSLEEQKQYWDILKEKNYDQWKWSIGNPEGNRYDPLEQFRTIASDQLGFTKENPIKTKEQFTLYQKHIRKLAKEKGVTFNESEYDKALGGCGEDQTLKQLV